MEQPNETAWQIISGFMGSVIPVAMASKITARKAIVFVLVGGIMSYYCAPVFSHFLNLTTPEFRSFVGFVTGLLGVQLAHAVLVCFRSAMIQALLGRWLSKIGYGDSNAGDTSKRS